MEKEEILKVIMELPKVKANKPISAINSISVDDLMSAVDRFDKVPTYDELSRENKKQKEIIDKAIDLLKHQIDILESKDMLHNREDDLLQILEDKEA